MRPGERFRAVPRVHQLRVVRRHAAHALSTRCPTARELTALWFLCERWDTEWGGETLFYDATGDAQIAVTPKPGRLLLFDGAIRHAGKPPNRNCPVARYTFAIKLRAA